MFELNIKAATASDLRVKLLDLVDHLKDINVNKRQEVENPPLVEVPVITPVITQEQMEENVQNAPVHEEPGQPTIEDVRAAMKELRDRKGAGAVREILNAYGAENLSKLKPEDYLGALARAKTEV